MLLTENFYAIHKKAAFCSLFPWDAVGSGYCTGSRKPGSFASSTNN